MDEQDHRKSSGAEQIRQKVAKALQRPEILVDTGQLRDRVALALKALQAANDPPMLYSRGGILTRLNPDTSELEAVDDSPLLAELSEAADWKKHGKKKNSIVDADPPANVIRAIRGQRELPFAPIEGIARAPFFTREGELVVRPGFHLSAKVYLSLDRQLASQLDTVSFPEHPMREDLEWAKSLLGELVYDFPFADNASNAHVIALGLLPFVRSMIDGPTPNHAVVAPPRGAGTGKGLLVQAVLAPSLGEIEAAPETKDREELRKVLLTVILENSPVYWVDNAHNEINAGPFAAVLTARNWVDRVLGKSKRFRGRVLTTWVITGNGVRVSGEMGRRTVLIRLDAGMAEPWKRSGFKHELPLWAYEHRAELIRANVILVRNWLALGRPAGKRTLGSFEAWARVIGGILEVAGIQHFLESPTEAHVEADQQTQRWKAFIEAWISEHKHGFDKAVTAQTLLPLADELVPDDEKSERSRVTRLGKLLGANVGAAFAIEGFPGGLKIVRAEVQRSEGGKHRGFALVEAGKSASNVGEVGGKSENPGKPVKNKENFSANVGKNSPMASDHVGGQKSPGFTQESQAPPTSPTSNGGFPLCQASPTDDEGDRF